MGVFHKRQLSQKHVVGGIIHLEDCSSHGQPAASQQQQMKHKHYTLEKHDADILLGKMAVVKSMTPADGFHPVGVGQTLNPNQ